MDGMVAEAAGVDDFEADATAEGPMGGSIDNLDASMEE